MHLVLYMTPLRKHLVDRKLVLAEVGADALGAIPTLLLVRLARAVLLARLALDAGARRCWRHKLLVGEHGRPAKRALKDADGGEDEAGPDLDERRLGWAGGMEGILLDDLVVAEPDAVVEDAEDEDVVNEGLEAARGARDGEDLE